jgi:hypothetical protein
VAEVNGVLLKGWLRFLVERFGNDPVERATRSLEPNDRKILADGFIPTIWYPWDAMHAMRRLTGVLAATARGDTSLAVEIGRAMSQNAFTGAYRRMLEKDPARQVAKMPVTVDLFFRETRTLEAEMLDGSSCAVRYIYEQGASPSRGICASIAGYWAQTLELAGAQGVTFAHPRCVSEGGPLCDFRFRWRA